MAGPAPLTTELGGGGISTYVGSKFKRGEARVAKLTKMLLPSFQLPYTANTRRKKGGAKPLSPISTPMLVRSNRNGTSTPHLPC